MENRIRFIQPFMDAEETLINAGPSVQISGDDNPQHQIQEFASLTARNIVALEIGYNEVLDEKTDDGQPFFAWIDGEIILGEEYRHRSPDRIGQPPRKLPSRVVIARTGTIFSAGEHDQVIFSKPTPVKL